MAGGGQSVNRNMQNQKTKVTARYNKRDLLQRVSMKHLHTKKKKEKVPTDTKQTVKRVERHPSCFISSGGKTQRREEPVCVCLTGMHLTKAT